MTVLIVVAHPDDEVLGCGGTMASLAKKGISVQAAFLSGEVEARCNRPELSDFYSDIEQAQKLLGVRDAILGDFPNIKFNTVPHLDLVKFIEQAIVDTKATTIFTHHPSDLNNDHLQTARACLAASRLYQRREDIPRLKNIFFMETLSATDWSYSGLGEQFFPDCFYQVDDTIDLKIEALHAYRNVMRDFPHPRSEEIIKSLAAYRGGQSKMRYAEAFQTAYRDLTANEQW